MFFFTVQQLLLSVFFFFFYSLRSHFHSVLIEFYAPIFCCLYFQWWYFHNTSTRLTTIPNFLSMSRLVEALMTFCYQGLPLLYDLFIYINFVLGRTFATLNYKSFDRNNLNKQSHKKLPITSQIKFLIPVGA